MKKISLLQYKAMIFLLPISMFFGFGLSNIAVNSKEDFFISIIIGTVIGTVIIYLFSNINEKNKNGLIKGKKVLYFILISLMFIYMGISILTNFITSIYLTEINPILIAIPLFILLLYAAFKGKNVVGMVSVLILVICLLLAFSIILSLIPEVNLRNYLPIFNVKAKTILYQSLNFVSYSVSPIILLNIYSPNEIENYKKTTIIKYYLLSCLMISIIFILTIGVMGIDLVSLYRYPEYIVLKKVSFFRFINNIENFNAFFWILTSLLLIIISGTCLKEALKWLTNNKYLFIGIIISLFIIIIFTTFNNFIVLLFLYKYQPLFLMGSIILFFLINLGK